MSSLSEQAENLSPEIKAAWEDFNTRVGAIVQDVFAPFSDNPFNIVIGAQFGGMGMPGSDMPPDESGVDDVVTEVVGIGALPTMPDEGEQQ